MDVMVAAIAQQATDQSQCDALRDYKEEVVVAGRGLTELRIYDPTKFKGEYDPYKTGLWLQEIDKIFEIFHCSRAMKVEYVTYLLIDEAEY